MDEIFDTGIMVDAGAGVEDDMVAQMDIGLDDCTGEDDRPAQDRQAEGDGQDERGQPVSSFVKDAVDGVGSLSGPRFAKVKDGDDNPRTEDSGEVVGVRDRAVKELEINCYSCLI